VETPDVPVPTVVKIDVEGAEVAVLDGLSGTLADGATRLVYCEIHRDQVADADVVDRLRPHGFEVETVYSRSNVAFVRAAR
jgi:hypothetical protein